VGVQQRWGKDEWLPLRIIWTYGPVTWAQDESWNYRTPIYMLNRIIRLQAVTEIITTRLPLPWSFWPSNRPKCEPLCIKIAWPWIIF
jgi:hypothetical protein